MAGSGVIWQSPGPERFLIFLAVWLAWSAAWLGLRRQWFVPATCVLVGVYTTLAVGILPLAATLFFLLACFVLGRLIGDSGPRQDWLLHLLTGLCAILCLVSLLAHFPVNYPAVYAALLALVLLVKPRATAECLRVCGAALRKTPDPMLAVALVPILAHWLVVLKPEVGADALSMHMAVPAYVADHHLWSFDFRHAAWAVMPMGGVWCYTVTYLLGGEFAARLLNLALMVTICAFIYRFARRWVAPATAYLLVALFAATPIVQMVTGSLFVEQFYAVLFIGALAALYEDRAMAAAFLLGSAMAVKLTALPFVLPAAVLLYRRKAALALLAAVAAPPYLYAWWKTGNPVFPFFNHVFHSPYFSQAATIDPRFSEPLTWRTLFDIVFQTHRYWEGQDGSAGFQFLLLPVVLLGFRRDWRFVTLALSGTLLALLAKPNLRYMYPSFAVLTAALAPALPRLGRALWTLCAICVVLNLWFLPSSSWYHKQFCMNPFDRGEAERYLATSAPERLAVSRLNRRYPGESALFLSTMDIAGLRGTAYSDGWHSYLFMQRVTALKTADEVAALFQQLGVRHFVFPNPAGGIPVREAQVRRFLSEYTLPEGEYGGVRLALRATVQNQPPGPAAPGSYDDFDPRILFYAHWNHSPGFDSAANQSITYSEVPDASFQLRFRGSAITWVYTKAFNRGIAQAFLDGRQSAAIDLYSPRIEWQSRMRFAAPANGEHTFEVRVSGKKNSQSSGTFVDVDELVVE